MASYGSTMDAMVLPARGRHLLELKRLPIPRPAPGQLLIRVRACAVCRTDLHILDDELPQTRHPIIPGHEIVGHVVERGPGAEGFRIGERVGVPWLGWTCGTCEYCRAARENLCPQARFTGCNLDGGYAEYAVADARYCFPLAGPYSDAEAAPLLCAGLIGYRALRKVGDARSVALYGFGAAAHLVAQLAVREGREIHAYTRPGDSASQAFARQLGAAWAGSSDQAPPGQVEAAIIFAPVGALVPVALRAIRPGGRVVCAGIHMSDIPTFPYAWLWQERELMSVANLTREDGCAFLTLAAREPLRTHVSTLPLAAANQALSRLRQGQVEGALVLVP